jgi:hypothetical protein
MKGSDILFLTTSEGIEDYIDEAKSRGAVTHRQVCDHSSDYVPYVVSQDTMNGQPIKLSVFNLFYTAPPIKQEWKFAHEIGVVQYQRGENMPFGHEGMAAFKNGDVVITHTLDEHGLIDQEYFYVCFLVRANGQDNPVFACIKATEPKSGYVEYLTIRKDKLAMASQQKTFTDAMLYVYGFPTMDNVVTDSDDSPKSDSQYSYKQYDKFGYYSMRSDSYSTYGNQYASKFPMTEEEKFLYYSELPTHVISDLSYPAMAARANYSLSIIETLIRSDFMFWMQDKYKKTYKLIEENWDGYKSMRDIARAIIDAGHIPTSFDRHEPLTFSDLAPLQAFIFGPAFSMVRYAMDIKVYGDRDGMTDFIFSPDKKPAGDYIRHKRVAIFNTKKFREILASKEWADYAVTQRGSSYDLLTGRVKPVPKDDFKFHVGDEVRPDPDYKPAPWEEVSVKPFKKGVVKAARKDKVKKAAFEYNVYDIEVTGYDVIGNSNGDYKETITVHEKALELFAQDYSAAEIASQDAALRRTIISILNPLMEAYLKERWDNFRHLFTMGHSPVFIGDKEQAREMAYNRSQLSYGAFASTESPDDEKSHKSAAMSERKSNLTRIDKLWITRNERGLPYGQLLFWDKEINANPQVQHRGLLSRSNREFTSALVTSTSFDFPFTELMGLFSLKKYGESQWFTNNLEMGLEAEEYEEKMSLLRKIAKGKYEYGELDHAKMDYNAIYEWLRYGLPNDKKYQQMISSVVFTPYVEKQPRRSSSSKTRIVESDDIVIVKDATTSKYKKGVVLLVKPGMADDDLEVDEVIAPIAGGIGSSKVASVEYMDIDRNGNERKTIQKLEPGAVVPRRLFKYVKEEIPAEVEPLHQYLRKKAAE